MCRHSLGPKQVVFESLRSFDVVGEIILKPVLLMPVYKALAICLSALISHCFPLSSNPLAPLQGRACGRGYQAVLSLCPGPRGVGSFSSFSSLFRCYLLSEAVLISSPKDPPPITLASFIYLHCTSNIGNCLVYVVDH